MGCNHSPLESLAAFAIAFAIAFVASAASSPALGLCIGKLRQTGQDA